MTETTPRQKIRERLHRPNESTHNASTFLLQFDAIDQNIQPTFADRWKIRRENGEDANLFVAKIIIKHKSTNLSPETKPVNR